MKPSLRLGINTGFALNRYPLPEQWASIVGSELGLRHVQLTADIFSPNWPAPMVRDMAARTRRCCKDRGINVESVMTGAFTRVNHLSHPDPGVRAYWLRWFKKFADMAVLVGARNLSSHLGILCYEDVQSPARRELLFRATVRSWRELAAYGKKAGLESLCWEPMSIRREYGETIPEARRIQGELDDAAIPINMCLDVDHGDAASPDKRDADYREWLREFARISPYFHLKQSLADKAGHYPFTREYNRVGKVRCGEFLRSLDKSNPLREVTLFLELSFREREPADSLVLRHLRESANYWKRGLNRHG